MNIPRMLMKKIIKSKSSSVAWSDFLNSDEKFLYAGTITRSTFSGYFGLNPFKSIPRHILHDVRNKMPIPNDVVDRYQSEDVFEHLPYEELVPIFNEIYRVLKPGGLFRLSLPDYRFNIYESRSLKHSDGTIYFDPEGGGIYKNGKVQNGGHIWFPVFELVQNLINESNFRECNVRFLHYNTSSQSVTNPIDYNLGHIQRTPDHDNRAQNPYRAMSIVVDIIKI